MTETVRGLVLDAYSKTLALTKSISSEVDGLNKTLAIKQQLLEIRTKELDELTNDLKDEGAKIFEDGSIVLDTTAVEVKK